MVLGLGMTLQVVHSSCLFTVRKQRPREGGDLPRITETEPILHTPGPLLSFCPLSITGREVSSELHFSELIIVQMSYTGVL